LDDALKIDAYVVYEDVGWIYQAQDWDYGQAFLKTARNIRVP
jgi:hypothetical protein